MPSICISEKIIKRCEKTIGECTHCSPEHFATVASCQDSVLLELINTEIPKHIRELGRVGDNLLHLAVDPNVSDEVSEALSKLRIKTDSVANHMLVICTTLYANLHLKGKDSVLIKDDCQEECQERPSLSMRIFSSTTVQE